MVCLVMSASTNNHSRGSATAWDNCTSTWACRPPSYPKRAEKSNELSANTDYSSKKCSDNEEEKELEEKTSVVTAVSGYLGDVSNVIISQQKKKLIDMNNKHTSQQNLAFDKLVGSPKSNVMTTSAHHRQIRPFNWKKQ